MCEHLSDRLDTYLLFIDNRDRTGTGDRSFAIRSVVCCLTGIGRSTSEPMSPMIGGKVSKETLALGCFYSMHSDHQAIKLIS